MHLAMLAAQQVVLSSLEVLSCQPCLALKV